MRFGDQKDLQKEVDEKKEAAEEGIHCKSQGIPKYKVTYILELNILSQVLGGGLQ